MTKTQLVQEMLAGRPYFVAEYRSSECIPIDYRDNQNAGRIIHGVAYNHYVELNGKQVKLKEYLPRDFTQERIKEVNTQPFPKGTIVVWEVAGLAMKKGHLEGVGKLIALDLSK
jgi:hypothetical protein